MYEYDYYLSVYDLHMAENRYSIHIESRIRKKK